MKKIFRATQSHSVLGPRLSGRDYFKYGLPYFNAWGTVIAENTDDVELLLASVEAHPELHIVSKMHDGRILNRYDEHAQLYNLHFGNTDPDIEFSTERCEDDIPPGNLAEFKRIIREAAPGIKKAVHDHSEIRWLTRDKKNG